MVTSKKGLRVFGAAAFAACLFQVSPLSTSAVFAKQYDNYIPGYFELSEQSNKEFALLGSGFQMTLPPLSEWLSSGHLNGLFETPPNSADRNVEQTQNTDTSNLGVFGSVLIPFRNISSRAKWERVLTTFEENNGSSCREAAGCSTDQTVFGAMVDDSKDLGFLDKLIRVNNMVNAMITYRTDSETRGVLDHWATPEETISSGYGDCEDYATLKLRLLLELGVPSNSMSIVVLKDLNRNLFHAVLAVSTSGGRFILDNVQAEVLEDIKLTQYQPLFSFSDDRSWIHGMPRDVDTMVSDNLMAGDIAMAAPGSAPGANFPTMEFGPAY